MAPATHDFFRLNSTCVEVLLNAAPTPTARVNLKSCVVTLYEHVGLVAGDYVVAYIGPVIISLSYFTALGNSRKEFLLEICATDLLISSMNS